MNWSYFKNVFFNYWQYIVFGLVSLVVAIVALYYISTQFKLREKRLDKIHVYRVRKRGELSPRVAPMDPVLDGVLFPIPEVYLPLQEKLSPSVDWGPPIRNWKYKGNPVPLQSAPGLRGPS